jgi:plastocyanin
MKKLIVVLPVLALLIIGMYLVLYPTSSPSAADELNRKLEEYGKQAVEGDTITIMNCQPSPRVLNVTYGKVIEFVNKDPVNHTIGFVYEPDLKLLAKGSMNLTVMSRYRGTYSYLCDYEEHNGAPGDSPYRGIFYIEESVFEEK